MHKRPGFSRSTGTGPRIHPGPRPGRVKAESPLPATRRQALLTGEGPGCHHPGIQGRLPKSPASPLPRPNVAPRVDAPSLPQGCSRGAMDPRPTPELINELQKEFRRLCLGKIPADAIEDVTAMAPGSRRAPPSGSSPRSSPLHRHLQPHHSRPSSRNEGPSSHPARRVSIT